MRDRSLEDPLAPANDTLPGAFPRRRVAGEAPSSGRSRLTSALTLVLLLLGCGEERSTSTRSSDAQTASMVAPSDPWPPSFEPRSIDGTGNDLARFEMGSTDEALLRVAPSDYDDGVSTPSGATRPSARAISNAVHAQPHPIANGLRASDLFWSWGQFLDHDLDLTVPAAPPEPFPIQVPVEDRWFDPLGRGDQTIALSRSRYAPGSRPREQLNQITAWIDASMIYGSDATRQAALRSADGTGRLRVDDSDGVGDLLPRNTGGLPNGGSATDPTLFLAGEERANENVLLTAMHTLWVREHNRVAELHRQRYPTASGDEVYEWARRWVGAEVQVITFEEWLPILLGQHGLPRYAGHDPTAQAGIFNEFAHAGFRFGHSLLSDVLLRLDARLRPIPAGPLPLRDAFSNPAQLVEGGGIEPLLRGAARQTCQELDAYVVDGVRNFLFGAPGSDGLDLASLNIQRGRDHGLPSYNELRRHLGLASRTDFDEVTSDPTVEAGLRRVYARVDDMDLWTGVIVEDHVRGGMAGELLAAILSRQFALLRDHDRLFYRRVFTRSEVAELETTRLGDVIRRNTSIGAELQPAVFITSPPPPRRMTTCARF